MDILSDVHFGTVDEEVYVYEVVRAACAELDEVFEVREAGQTTAVGDCRGAELDGAVVRLHVALVDCDALGWREVGFQRVVGFVGAVGLFSRSREGGTVECWE